jgi:hypothetical protein
VTIPTGHAENALRIPNAALTYTPDLPAAELDRLYRRYAISEAARSSHLGGWQVVWKLAGDQLEPVAVQVGISDYAYTERVAGKLQEGDPLVTGAMAANAGGKNSPKPPRPAQGGGRPR